MKNDVGLRYNIIVVLVEIMFIPLSLLPPVLVAICLLGGCSLSFRLSNWKICLGKLDEILYLLKELIALSCLAFPEGANAYNDFVTRYFIRFSSLFMFFVMLPYKHNRSHLYARRPGTLAVNTEMFDKTEASMYLFSLSWVLWWFTLAKQQTVWLQDLIRFM